MHICAIQHLLSDGTKAQLVDRLRSHASVLQARADAASAAEALALKVIAEKLLCRQEEALLKAGALQNAIFNSANFSSIATDAKGVIQIFNVGAERMLGYTAAEVLNKITPADISDKQELIARAKALSIELGIPVASGVEALVFKASRGMEDIYELTYFRKVISVLLQCFHYIDYCYFILIIISFLSLYPSAGDFFHYIPANFLLLQTFIIIMFNICLAADIVTVVLLSKVRQSVSNILLSLFKRFSSNACSRFHIRLLSLPCYYQ